MKKKKKTIESEEEPDSEPGDKDEDNDDDGSEDGDGGEEGGAVSEDEIPDGDLQDDDAGRDDPLVEVVRETVYGMVTVVSQVEEEGEEAPDAFVPRRSLRNKKGKTC